MFFAAKHGEALYRQQKQDWELTVAWVTGVGYHFLLWGFFLTQGSNPGLLHCRQILYRLSHRGSPLLIWIMALPLVLLFKIGRAHV